jgi:hypothetical protein
LRTKKRKTKIERVIETNLEMKKRWRLCDEEEMKKREVA